MKKEIWANHFLKIENCRITRKGEFLFIGKREIRCRYDGIFFECWFGIEGNYGLDICQMEITGTLKKRIKKMYDYNLKKRSEKMKLGRPKTGVTKTPVSTTLKIETARLIRNLSYAKKISIGEIIESYLDLDLMRKDLNGVNDGK